VVPCNYTTDFYGYCTKKFIARNSGAITVAGALAGIAALLSQAADLESILRIRFGRKVLGQTCQIVEFLTKLNPKIQRKNLSAKFEPTSWI
jgi:hypothetical protein